MSKYSEIISIFSSKQLELVLWEVHYEFNLVALTKRRLYLTAPEDFALPSTRNYTNAAVGILGPDIADILKRSYMSL